MNLHYRTDSNLDALCAAYDTAKAAVTDTRWLNAIDTAFNHLLEEDTVTIDTHAATLTLILPSASGRGEYRANGVCQCRAAATGNACWHRACARLVRNAMNQPSAVAAFKVVRRG
jgi:hypothetical protein